MFRGECLFVLRSLNDTDYLIFPPTFFFLLDSIPEIKYISLTIWLIWVTGLLLEQHYLGTGFPIFYKYVLNK